MQRSLDGPPAAAPPLPLSWSRLRKCPTTPCDRRGAPDRAGDILQSSEIAIADEAAGAASLLMGQGDEGLPIVIIRGLDWAAGTGNAADLVRPPELDLFR